MPVYDYRCLACRHVFWKVVGVVSSEPGLACPSCGGLELEKLISSFNTSFYLERAEAAGRDLLKEMAPGPDPGPEGPRRGRRRKSG